MGQVCANRGAGVSMKRAVLAKDKRAMIEGELGRRLLLGETIVRNVRKYPNKEALVYGKTRLTYKQFNSYINHLAHALLDIGITKGTKVAVLSFNCNQFLEA